MSNEWVIGTNVGFSELNVSNELLDDRDALEQAFERDGYLFFRNVLDQAVVSRLRQAYLDELVKLGVVNPGDQEGRYNGADLSILPKNPVSGPINGLMERAPWKEFVKDPTVHSLLTRILGDEPFWLPILGYRIAKPGGNPSSERFDFVHQDGFYNIGIPMRNCWIPLVEMGPEVGGLAIAEGMHTVQFHELGEPPEYQIPIGSIPRSAWRITHYLPGDLVILHLDTPHSGVTNVSQDRFRMSIDLRLLPASGEIPVIGKVVEATPERFVVRDDSGAVLDFTVDENTYCRGNITRAGSRIPASELPSEYNAGDDVILGHQQGRATVIRPAVY